MSKNALITGITGQDGRYLAEYLHSLGYSVFGLVSSGDALRQQAVADNFPYVHIIEGDLRDTSSLLSALEISVPDEAYNLGAMSSVGNSWKQPIQVSDVTGLGVLRFLEAIRIYTGDDVTKVRFFQASSSEMYGQANEAPQVETTPLSPRSPYGIAKAFGHNVTVNFRESLGMFASSGILFNHESPRRGEEFVTRKITKAVARIALGKQEKLHLGSLDSKRDWGFAGDYVKAMHAILQQSIPQDFVIATGETHSVREFCDLAFDHAGIVDWHRYVDLDSTFLRPAEVNLLVGDATKAKNVLGWSPSTSFQELVEMMVDADLRAEA